MAPGIVFSDMDGTFVTTNKEIPAENWAALDTLAAADIEFVPCSGRGITGLPPELLAHPAVQHVVTTNGALVYEQSGADGADIASWRPICSHTMDRAVVLDLYQALEGRDVTFDVFFGGQAYAEAWRYENLERYGMAFDELKLFKSTRCETTSSIPELLRDHPQVEKITSFWIEEADRDYYTALVDADPRIVWASSVEHNIEVSDVEATKGVALMWLCEHLGIARAASVAFGDQSNDISMLEAAGTGVAMANATPEVTAIADATTTDCDHAGVAAWISAALTS